MGHWLWRAFTYDAYCIRERPYVPKVCQNTCGIATCALSCLYPRCGPDGRGRRDRSPWKSWGAWQSGRTARRARHAPE